MYRRSAQRPALVLAMGVAAFLSGRAGYAMPARGGPLPRGEGLSERTGSQEAAILLNGKRLGRGIVLGRIGGDERVFLPVADLVAAVDGPLPGAAARLELRGLSLYASVLGGCEGCAIRVSRPVLISSRLRLLNGEPHLPLPDLVRAFEGRVEFDPATGAYGIYAGSCRWCILEPNSRQ